MSNENKAVGEACAGEIISARIFNAPREVVFKAWEDPELLKAWWGPQGFTNSFDEFDFKAGGIWKFTMHSPDGTDYPNLNVFEEIIKPGLIILNHLEPHHAFKAITTLEAIDDKTSVRFHMIFESVDECERIKPYLVIANEQNFDRLETVLLTQ